MKPRPASRRFDFAFNLNQGADVASNQQSCGVQDSKTLADCLPMPLPAPVTIAICPLNIAI